MVGEYEHSIFSLPDCFPAFPKHKSPFELHSISMVQSVFISMCDSNSSLVKCLSTLSQTSLGFYVSAVQVFRKHCRKRRNCSQRAISPFHTLFSTLLENFTPFSSNLKLSSANSFSLEESKICRFGKG